MGLAWFQNGLNTDNPLPFNLTKFSIGIADAPVAAQELHRAITEVLNGDPVSMNVLAFHRAGVVVLVVGFNAYLDALSD